MAVNGTANGAVGNATTLVPPGSTVPRPQQYATKGFRIKTLKMPILKAGPIEEMTEKLGIAPPEMIFGDNFVTIEHARSGWGIVFNASDALDRVDKTGEKRLKVAHSQEWHKSRYRYQEHLAKTLLLTGSGDSEGTHDIKEIIKPFDWSYTTDFKGTLSPTSKSFKPTDHPIPIDLLKRPDPIQFYDDVMLYEDELADNGIAMLSCKIRCMPSRLLLLQRFFMRLDNVLLRIRDTRVYVDFDTGEVIREYLAKEEEYEQIRVRLAATREDVTAALRDPNQIADLLPVVERVLESVNLQE